MLAARTEETAVSLLLTWLANSFAIYITAYLMASVEVASLGVALLAGAALTLVNSIVKPVLVLFTLPFTIVTLGLFYFIVTAFCLYLASVFVPGFILHGLLTTIVASMLIGLFSAIINRILTRASDK
jgi:putative membrane protein